MEFMFCFHTYNIRPNIFMNLWYLNANSHELICYLNEILRIKILMGPISERNSQKAQTYF